jgi:hypothetical protein
LQTSAAPRFTTDGGVSWSTSTGSFSNAAGQFYRQNATTAGKFIAGTSPTTLYITTNSGASFSAIPLNVGGFGGTLKSLAYAGSTILATDNGGVLLKSTNDGASFTRMAGFSGQVGNVLGAFHDGYRWYVTTDAQEIFTSTDASTWTRRVAPVWAPGGYTVYFPGSNYPSDIAAADSNNVVMTASDGSSVVATWYSSDGGVTWKCARPTYNAAFHSCQTACNTFQFRGGNSVQ